MTARRQALRLCSVGILLWGSVVAPAPAQPARTGEQVYAEICAACHAAGIAHAPEFGNAKAWRPLIAEGQAVVTAHAWVGVRAMPPRAGRDDLSLEEFSRAAAFMARAAGALWPDPDAALLASIALEERLRRAGINARDCGPGAQAAGKDRGGAQVYREACAACHARGVANAPRFGDRLAWQPRLEGGQPAVTAQAWLGLRAMPPRGGRDNLALPEFARGVAYMARAAGARWRDPDAKMLTAIQEEEKNRRGVISAN